MWGQTEPRRPGAQRTTGKHPPPRRTTGTAPTHWHDCCGNPASPMNSADLELIHLVKRYRGTVAVDRIDLKIAAGRYCLDTSRLGAHLTWTLPFGLLIMFAVFNRFNPAYEEAARDLCARRGDDRRVAAGHRRRAGERGVAAAAARSGVTG